MPSGTRRSRRPPNRRVRLRPFPELAVAIDRERRRGRGAQSNASGRYEAEARVAFDDGWQTLEELPPFKTTVDDRHRAQGDHAQRLARHRLRSLDQSLSRLRAWLRLLLRAADARLSRPVAGARFRIEAVSPSPTRRRLLAKELAAPDYEPRMIAIGTNTDPYQPIERERKIMRGILEVLEHAGHPVGIVTKSALVVRDIDILSRMAKRNLAKVAISVTTLDPKLARTMEPRAPTPPKRLEALKAAVGGGHSDHGDGRAR